MRQIVDLDRLLASIASHPDQLLGQMLPCAQNPPDGRSTQPGQRATRVVKEMARQPV